MQITTLAIAAGISGGLFAGDKEDDPQLGDGLAAGMRQSGFAVDWLKDGAGADVALKSESFDLVVLDLDPATHQVLLAGQRVELGTREFAILHALLENAGRVMTRAQLETSIYGWSEEPDSNAVEVHIHHLRRKLGADFIKTLRGVGYLVEKAR